ncbi:MAG TPA: hypothetical protein PLO37_10725 [Candidatus Hydrogenedentes bacterium]|nr:hypothetical protein [Candidatus Hydrogenedentota bacterium]HPG67310.1 hypothetical protein [Candidatus Hydrogenedentota bacterium]
MSADSARTDQPIRRRVSLLSSLHELDPSPRKFMVFQLFNVISWQCLAGAVAILFARAIDMPPSWVGWLISFLPLSTLLVVTTVPLVTRLGPKRLMLCTWLVRNLIICAVFFMPWALDHWGFRAGWYVLLAATLGFCVVRALGVGGWFPWVHEMVPERQRGVYFSAETSIARLVTIGVALTQGLVLVGNPGVNRYLAIYVVGVAAGLVSVWCMASVPGGKALEASLSLRRSFATYKTPLTDRAYMVFAVTAMGCFSALAWLTSAYVLYMRDMLGLSSGSIMVVTAVANAFPLLTIRAWARFADHSGSGRAMSKALLAHSLVALSFLAIVPGHPGVYLMLVPAIVLTNVFYAAFWMAAQRAMLFYVQPEGRVSYTNLWMLITAIATGITPILAGAIIDRWMLNGFRACFGLSGVLGLAGAVACRWAVRDGAPLGDSLSNLLNPVMPLRVLARVVWITVGMHESNRAADTTDTASLP